MISIKRKISLFSSFALLMFYAANGLASYEACKDAKGADKAAVCQAMLGKLLTHGTIDPDYGGVENMQMLINGGADLNATDGYGMTPFQIAVLKTHRQFPKHETIYDLMLKHGANINHQDKRGENILFKNINAKTTEYLVRNGANVNARDNNGSTALIVAASANYFDVVEVLLSHGADAGAKNKQGENAICLSRRNFLTRYGFPPYNKTAQKKADKQREMEVLLVKAGSIELPVVPALDANEKKKVSSTLDGKGTVAAFREAQKVQFTLLQKALGGCQ